MLRYIIIGPLHIPAFSLMILLGVVAFTICLILILEKVEKIERKTVNRILIIGAVGFVALAVFAFFFNSLFHSIQAGKLQIGGITWLGGVLGAFPLTVWLLHKFCPRIKGNALFYFNLLIPAIVLAHGFGRVGCFCGGCCYGKETESIFGVQFPHLENPVYPTQLYEAAFEFVLFALMMIFYKKWRTHFLEIYCFSYGVFRFALEFLRGDNRGSVGFFLSPSQVMSILLILGGVLLVLYNKNLIFKKLYAKMETYKKQSEKYGAYVKEEVLYVLKQLQTLQADGVITKEEYEKTQEELLKRL